MSSEEFVGPYGRRGDFFPRKVEDFGDGGAFPEIHVSQYPLDMGWKERRTDSEILSVNADAKGNIAFGTIVKQSKNASYVDSAESSEEEEGQEICERTTAELEKLLSEGFPKTQPKSVPKQNSAPSYTKNKPSQQ